jgi:DNA polymerase-3 subunit delta'
LAGGSLRQAIVLLDGEGIAVYRALAAFLSGLPAVDYAAAHELAVRVGRYRDDQAWSAFLDLTRGWLNRRVRGIPEPEASAVPAAVAAAPLERWAQVWDNLTRLSLQTDDLNLDRKRTVLSILMEFARATRM